jgi:hypothetical protein
MEAFQIHKKLIGTTKDGRRVRISVNFQDATGQHQTTDHRTIEGGQRLSITGETVDSGGQILDDVRNIDRPAAGFTFATLQEVLTIWEQYHLNDMNALCDHQTVVWEETNYGKRMDLAAIGACPVSGYRPGSAWLYREVPGLVVRRLAEILK